MNLTRKKSALILICSVIVLASCSLSKMIKLSEQQQLTVTPNPLEVHADSVKVNISALLPIKMLKKKKIPPLV